MFGYSQTIKTKQSLRILTQQRNIYLNGGARASVGGKSRNADIKIVLPRGTKSWYYSFTTSPGESGTKNLNLAIQLSSYLVDPSGITKSALEQVDVPTGSGSVDIYLLDYKDVDPFLNKVDNNGGTFYYKREGSVFNTKQALVEINEHKEGIFYLGLKNPSSLEGINIFIEVVAVIEEVESLTDEQSEAMTFGNLGWKAFERGDYDKCIDLSRKAIALDKSLGFVYFNIALSHLIKGENDIALEQYTKAISVTKKTFVAKQTFSGAIDDLEKYMDKFPSQAEAKDILDIVKEELKALSTR